LLISLSPQTLPLLLKSAVSATKTLIFVPSYFDFVRLDAYLRKQDVSFAAISE
jgi:U3 small nucleolar RNA-associated protein 25